MLLIALRSRIQKEFACECKVSELFACESFERLCELIDETMNAKNSAHVVSEIDVERKLKSIWKGLIGVEMVFDDDIFVVPDENDTLMEVLREEIESVFAITLNMSQFQLNPSFHTLLQLTLAVLKNTLPSIDNFCVKILEYSTSRKCCFLSLPQQRLWFLDQLLPGQSTYNIPLSWLILNPFSSVFLREALRSVIQRHEILRTSFRNLLGVGVLFLNRSLILFPSSTFAPFFCELRHESSTNRTARSPRFY